MTKLTPSEAIKARETLNLSQSRVARDTGLSRSYLSQFENGKRILEDRWLNTLYEYYSSLGWSNTKESTSDSTESNPPSPTKLDHKLNIVDGFVIPIGVEAEYVVEDLMDEFYDNSQKIEKCRHKKISRNVGFLFGDDRGIDNETAYEESRRMLILMARQYEIIQILHGQHENCHSGVTTELDTVKTVGDYVAALICATLPDRVFSVDEMAEALEEAS